jgi:hypothetical protein
MVDSSIINSIMGGLAWGDGARRQDEYLKMSIKNQERMARDEERRAKHEQLASQVRDLDMIQRLQEFGRPVQDGMVDSEFEVTPELAGTIPGLPAGMKIKAPRKARNPFTYRDSTGNAHQVELLSPRELLVREAEREKSKLTARGEASAAARTAERQGLLERFGITTEDGRFLPDELDKVASYRRAKDASKPKPKPKPMTAPAQGWRAFTDYSTGDVTYTRMNPETGQPEVRTAVELKGIAAPRARGSAAPAKSGGRASSSKAPTVGQIQGLAEQAILDSKDGGGGRVEDAIRNLENRQNYVGTALGDNRFQIIAHLKKQLPRTKPGAGVNRWRETPAQTAAATGAGQAATQSAKAISISQVQAYANKFGISVSEAKKKAEAEGYKVQ